MSSEAQIRANRRNAKKSTGPVTELGRNNSRMNALQHGITRQVTIMTDEDRPAFNEYCRELLEDFAPKTAHERHLAQAIAEDYWRLDRSRAAENNLFSLGHFEEPGDIDADHPRVHAAFTQARVFRDEAHTLQLMTLYEQRINRSLHKNLALLRQLQAEREAAHHDALETALKLHERGVEAPQLRATSLNPRHKTAAQTNATEALAVNGFVFSNDAMDRELDRRDRFRNPEPDPQPDQSGSSQPLQAAA